MTADTEAKQWFPMRVTYSRELRVKAFLDAQGIETFVPMQYQWVERDGRRYRQLLPAIHNLIFVRSTQQHITRLKMYQKEAEPLRYIMEPHPTRPDETHILTIPDRQMDNFLRVARHTDDSVIFLGYKEAYEWKGREVLIADGPFAGVTGRILRVQDNKRVVVALSGIAAVAIEFTPKAFITPV